MSRAVIASLGLALMLFLASLAAHADTFTATVKETPGDSDSTAAMNDTDSDAAPDSTGSAVDVDKAGDTPHFWQRDPRGNFENGGRDYCCPVAVSNSFVYLAKHGFDALLPEGDGAQPQIDLINDLASNDYFGTDPDTGTGPGALLTGIRKYVEDKGYTCERLEYEGWRNVGNKERASVKAPRASLTWLEQGIANPKGAAWLNVGWYVHGTGANEWKRVGGHWVTLIGYGGTGVGETPDPELFFIRNPATRATLNEDLSAAEIHLHTVPDGVLQVGGNATQSSRGMFQITGPALPLGQHVDAAFLDGAVVLRVGS